MSELATDIVKPEGLIGLLVRIERALCGVCIVVMALLTTSEVICRAFLGFSLLINDEISGYLLVAISFLGLGVALGEGALFRVGFFYDTLHGTARRVADLIFDILALGVACVLVYQMIDLAWSSYDRGVTAPTMLRTPLYIPQSTMVIGALCLAVILVVRILDHLRNFRGNRT